MLLVLLVHVMPGAFPGGGVGVDVFFVLSGCLITGLLLDERDRTGRVDLAAFSRRRARRLGPALLLLLGVWSALALARPQTAGLVVDASRSPGALTAGTVLVTVAAALSLSADELVAHGVTAVQLGHLWSLAAEERFYLLWPWLLVRLHRVRPLLPAVALVLALVASVVLAQRWSGTAAGNARAYFSGATRSPSLLVGAAVAGLERVRPVRVRLPRVLAAVALAVLVLLAVRPGTCPAAFLPPGAAVAAAGLLVAARQAPPR